LEFYACVLDRAAMPLKVRRLVEHLAKGLGEHPSLRWGRESSQRRRTLL